MVGESRRSRLRRMARALVVGADARAVVTSTTEALRAMARGDLTRAALDGVREPTLRAALEAMQQTLRAVVRGARGTHRDATSLVGGIDVACRALADGAARQRVALDRALEESQRAALRAEELSPWASEISEGAERIGVLSLNVGIEGLRGGTEAARALIALGEEIRRTALRVATTADALSAGTAEVGRALAASQSRLEEARSTGQALGAEVARASAAVESARASAVELRDALAELRLLDDDTEALVASVTAAAERLAHELKTAQARVRDEAQHSAARDAVDRAVRALAALAAE